MRAREVEVFDEALARHAERMIALMHDASGVGLAANQVGSLQRMFTIELGDEEPAQAIVNPRITPLGDELETDEEGCLSLRACWCRSSARSRSASRLRVWTVAGWCWSSTGCPRGPFSTRSTISTES